MLAKGPADLQAALRRLAGVLDADTADLVALLRRLGRALYIEQNIAEHLFQNIFQNFRKEQVKKIDLRRAVERLSP